MDPPKKKTDPHHQLSNYIFKKNYFLDGPLSADQFRRPGYLRNGRLPLEVRVYVEEGFIQKTRQRFPLQNCLKVYIFETEEATIKCLDKKNC